MFLPWLGTPQIIDPSDGFFTESAREMLEKGDYLTPYLNYEFYFDKPIGIQWLIACSYKIFGITPFAARLPSALSAILCTIYVFRFCATRLRVRTTILAVLLLLSSPLFLVIGRISLIDMPLCLACTVGGLALYEAICQPVSSKTGRTKAAIGYLAMAIGVLLKGPIAVVLIGMPLAIYAGIQGKDFILRSIQRSRPILGVVILLTLALPWYVAEGIATNGLFLSEFFMRHHLARAAGGLVMSHIEPFWYFVPILLVGAFPWSLYLPVLARRTWRRLKTRGSSTNTLGSLATERSRLKVLCALWSLSIFIFFSSIVSKLSTYIVPMIPALSILIACCIDEELRAQRRTLFVIWLGAAVLVGAAGMTFLSIRFGELIPGTYIVAIAINMAILCIAYLVFALKRISAPKAVISFATLACLFHASFIPILLQWYYQYHQADYASLLEKASSMNLNLAEVQEGHPSAAFYLKKKVPVLKQYFDFAAFLARGDRPHALLMRKRYLSVVAEQRVPYIKEVASRGKYGLYIVEDEKQSMLQYYYNTHATAPEVDPVHRQW